MDQTSFAVMKGQAPRRHPISGQADASFDDVSMLRLYRGIVAGLGPAVPLVQFTGAGPSVGTSHVVRSMGDAVSRTGLRAASFDLSMNETGLDPLIARTRPLSRDVALAGSGGTEAGFPFVDPAFDFVLVDTAPILTSPLSMTMAAGAGGTVLVVEADRSTEREIRESLQVIADCGGRCLGLLLNKTPAKGRRWWRRSKIPE